MADISCAATATTVIAAVAAVMRTCRMSAAAPLSIVALAPVSRARNLSAASDMPAIASAATVTRIRSMAAAPALAVTAASTPRRNPGFTAPASVVSMSAVFASPIRNPGFAAAASIAFGAILSLPKEIPVSAVPGFSIAAAAAMSKATPATAAAKMDFTAKACADRGRDAIGVCEVVADILHLWGFTNPRSAPSYAVSRALTDLNAGLQVVWNQADMRDYWSKSTLEIEILAGESSLALPDDVQNVTGLCRLKDSRRTLVALGTLGELELFPDLYLDGESVGDPVAYHIQRENQAGNDPARCVFHVTPAPAADTDFLLEVVREAPRFGIRDVTDCPRIPIPHRYVESLLLPVVRKRAASYYLFTAADKLPVIEQEYMEARMALGMADPLPGNAGDNMGKRRGGEA